MAVSEDLADFEPEDDAPTCENGNAVCINAPGKEPVIGEGLECWECFSEGEL